MTFPMALAAPVTPGADLFFKLAFAVSVTVALLEVGYFVCRWAFR
jgi:hypothetical protein